MLIAQIIIRLCEIIILVYIVLLTFEYRETLEITLGQGSLSLDVAIINRLYNKAESINHRVKVWCIYMACMMLIDFIFTISLDGLFDKIERSNIPAYTHRYLRPKNWRNCFEGMWYDRVKNIKSKLLPAIVEKDSHQVTWKTDWNMWTKYVTAYDSSVHQKND
jgi:hypothetical protein